MNVEQLRKNVGSIVKIRPIAIRKDPYTGAILPVRDDDWMIERVQDGKVSLYDVTCPYVVVSGTTT